jgi:hypothetical protein
MKDRVDFAITQRVNRLRIDEFNVYVQTFGAKKTQLGRRNYGKVGIRNEIRNADFH